MKTARLFLLFLLVLLSLGTCTSNDSAVRNAQMGDLVTLENPYLSLTIKASPTPHISQLVHKKTGTDLVTELPEPKLFAIVFEGQDGEVSSASAAQVRVLQPNAYRPGIDITFSDFPDLDLTVRVRVRLEGQSRFTLWSMSVENNTPRAISLVRFPILQAVANIGEADDDFIVLPDLPGTLIRAPRQAWNPGMGVALRYPGELSSQFITYQDVTAGIYFASMDTVGYEKRLVIRRGTEGFEIFHGFTPPADAQPSWHSPYPVAVGVTQGAWYNSADIYKAWAVGQPWCAKTLAERVDVPGWLRRGPLVYTLCVRAYDENDVETGSYYPEIPGNLRRFRSLTEGHIVVMLANWEQHRAWTAGDYFPVFDEQNARRIIAQIKADGTEGYRPFFFLSGLNYTFENLGINSSTTDIPVPDEYRPAFALTPEGDPYVLVLDTSRPGYPWIRRSYVFCVSSPPTRAFFRSVIDQCLDLGVSILQMDQTVEGAGPTCYSSEHGHPPGTGLYRTQGFHALLQDMREYGKSKVPDFALFHEEPHEELIPYLDGFHMREYTETQWYRGYPGAVGIPLFSYLYHEYAIGYGGDGPHIGTQNANSRWYVRAHAVNLVTGKTPAAAIWSYPEELDFYDPDAVAMLRNQCRLLDAGASRYLIEGRMLHPLPIDAPPVTYRFSYQEGGVARTTEFTEPGILTSSWQASDGCVGHVFVNTSGKEQPLKVVLDTRNAPDLNSCDVYLYRSGTGEGFSPLWTNVWLPHGFFTVLARDEVLFLDIRRQGQ